MWRLGRADAQHLKKFFGFLGLEFVFENDAKRKPNLVQPIEFN